ncbi:hypothetical protein EV182_001730 [Spiromyces aspiralis]|uniref:Uncharacterized protein n=1 Tax=Spiromyces aspiralis TaxID=68401 RepID=A0ACC1HFF9_9FUNG|nr:hypothetical protein EV182_001730 [Spiromyces aspiralis]
MSSLLALPDKVNLVATSLLLLFSVLVFCISCGVVANAPTFAVFYDAASYYVFLGIFTLVLSPILFSVSQRLRPLFRAMPLSHDGMGRLITVSLLGILWFAGIIAGAVKGGKSHCGGASSCQAFKAAVAFSWFAFFSLCWVWWAAFRRFGQLSLERGQDGVSNANANAAAAYPQKTGVEYPGDTQHQTAATYNTAAAGGYPPTQQYSGTVYGSSYMPNQTQASYPNASMYPPAANTQA